MLSAAKVGWKEGMFFQPQHFQQSERSVLGAAGARFAALQPYGSGVMEVMVDEDALAGGVVSVTRLHAVLPDGTVADLPAHGPLPAPRPLDAHFALPRSSVDVFVGLPVAQEGQASVHCPQTELAGPVRYRARPVEIADEVLGGNRREIELAEPQCTIRFGDESLDGCCAVRVARLMRAASGAVVLDRSFVPPCLRIGASPALLEQLRGLLEQATGRAGALSDGRRELAGGVVSFAGQDPVRPLLLLVLNAHAPLLAQYLHDPAVHPFQLYAVLSSLCGALCTFSSDYAPERLPFYNHDDPGACFARLIETARGVLGADAGSACTRLALEPAGKAMWVCRVSDPRLLSQSRLYLGVSAETPAKELIVSVLQRLKAASRERLDVIVAAAIPGLPLRHEPNPPEQLPTRPNTACFAVTQQGEQWEGVRTAGTLALYLPGDYPNLQLELFALRG